MDSRPSYSQKRPFFDFLDLYRPCNKITARMPITIDHVLDRVHLKHSAAFFCIFRGLVPYDHRSLASFR